MITLYTSYYRDKNMIRQHELDHCLQMNISNPLIDRIVLMVEGVLPPEFDLSKVHVIHTNRPTYKNFFEAINQYCRSYQEISIVANTDIYFDKTLADIRMNNRICLALSRYDVKPGKEVKLHCERGSQDCWIFMGKVKPVRFADFNLGVPGCDNRIAWELNRAGYIMQNPATKIKCYHYHPSDLHTYQGSDGKNIPYLFIPKPYLFVELT